jgi:hypothetical protein
VDFIDLNRACPKDPFPLPKIDQLVDSKASHERMSFLDAFQGKSCKETKKPMGRHLPKWRPTYIITARIRQGPDWTLHYGPH